MNHGATFISHADHLEDVMLWRALRDLERGFYIDIFSPESVVDAKPGSVTRAFYERGWVGLNVTPDLTAHQTLVNERPRDILLNNNLGCPDVQPDNTLGSIWLRHLTEHQAVHVLRIASQGHETNILSGNDWTRCRPWVVLVTARRVEHDTDAHAAWEPILLHHQYRLAYADGLNRFYVAAEHSALLGRLRFPPHVFDDYQIASHQQAALALAETTLRLRALETRYQQVLQQSIAAKVMSDWAQTQLQAAHDSLSWRITSPVRRLQSTMRSWFGADWKSRLKSAIKRSLNALARRALKHPRSKAFAIRLATHLGVYHRFKSFLSGQSFFGALDRNEPDAPSHFWISTPRSRRVRADLCAEIEKIKRENA